MKNVYLKLLLISLFTSILSANVSKIALNEFNPSNKFLRMSNAQANVIIPIANRWTVKKAQIHLEFSPSKALIPKRSIISVFLNGVVIFQTKLDPKIDLYSEDITIPTSLLKDYNNLAIKASQHYCLDCCENPSSSELWTEILWKSSYIKTEYTEKPYKKSLLYFKNYVLDINQYSPINFNIVLQNKTPEMITIGAKIAGYLGSQIKYRKLHINYSGSISSKNDTIVIGTKQYIKNLFNLKNDDIPDVFTIANLLNPSKSILIITGNNIKSLQNNINAFMAIKKELLMGKQINFFNYITPKFNAYETPLYAPLDKKVYLSDLGYSDFKFFDPLFEYSFDFTIPVDLFRNNYAKFKFHIAYNYSAGARKDSTINVFINNKFIASLKFEKKYGTVLEEKTLEIPLYLLIPGKNTIKVQYAFVPQTKDRCSLRNTNTFAGTLFVKKSYIELPKMPHWIRMPYMEYFMTYAYPFSVYPDLSKTQIFLSNTKDDLISALFTLSAYIGEKTHIPPFRLNVITDKNKIKSNNHIIALGYNFPKDFYKNLPIEINNNSVVLKYNIIQTIKTKLEKFMGKNEAENLRSILKMNNTLEEETVLSAGKSPFSNNNVIFIITSKSNKNILNTVNLFYEPKFAGKIKGDIAVVDNINDKISSANVGNKFYLGHLPVIDYILFRIGFSPAMLILTFTISVIILIFILKILLAIRARMRLRGRV